MIDVCESAPSWIRTFAPYVPGKPASEVARELGLPESGIVKLASNENPLGPSAKAQAAMQAALPDIARYPDANGFELKRALSARFGVDTAQIAIGNGSNDVLELAARTFLSPGTSAVYAKHAFAVYPLSIQSVGATGIEVPAREFGHDPDAMVAAIRDDTRMLFIANPNNPTGTFLRGEVLAALLAKVPRRVVVVLDEAYTEYLPDAQRYDSIAWLKSHPNLVITRTFSKAYGLAGMRVGFALSHPDVADLMNRIRQPFNVNTVAQAGAIAALHDDDYVARSRRLNDEGLRQLIAGFGRMDLPYIPSFGNFVCVRVGDAAGIFRRLLERGVIVRPVGGYAMPEWLRISVGLPAENERFLEALGAVLAPAVAHR